MVKEQRSVAFIYGSMKSVRENNLKLQLNVGFDG